MLRILKPYYSNHFECDWCLRKFYQTTAYAPDSSLKETYCIYCLEAQEETCSFQSKYRRAKCLNPLFNKKRQLCRQHYYQIWKELNQAKKKTFRKVRRLDKRVSGRTKQLNLKVSKKTYRQLKRLATKNGCLLTEMLERLLESYGKSKKTKSKPEIVNELSLRK